MSKPLYLNIKEQLLNTIKNLPKNSPIASERDLASKYSASRMTVRAAINELVDNGYLYRDGRRGTFTAEKTLIKCNTIQHYFTNGNEFHLLHMNIKQMPDIADIFQVDIDTQFVRVLCTNIIDGDLISIDELFIIYEDLEPELRGNIEKLMRLPRFYTENTKVKLIPMLAPAKYVNLLKLKSEKPIIMAELSVMNKLGKLKYFVRSYLNPDTTEIISSF